MIRGGATDLSGVEKEPLYDLGRRWVIGAAGLYSDRCERSADLAKRFLQRFLDQWSTGAQQAAAQRGLAQLRQLDFTLHYPPTSTGRPSSCSAATVSSRSPKALRWSSP